MALSHPDGPVKARIIDQEIADGGRDIEILYNPASYSIGKATGWAEHPVLLSDIPKIEFVGGGRRRLGVDLVLDTSREGRDVRTEADRIEALMRIDPDLHRPPGVIFSWGSLQFEGVLEEMDAAYVHFARDGTPVRALARLVFRERPVGEERDRKPLQSPDRAKRRRLKEGDTLPLVAHEEYGDAGAWRRIAEANGIPDPDVLPIGRVIHVPPLERRNAR